MQSSFLHDLSRLCDENRHEEISKTISARFSLDAAQSAHVDAFVEELRQGRASATSLIDGVKLSPGEVALLQTRFPDKPSTIFNAELDFFAESVPENLATSLIYAANRFIPKTGKVAVVASVRNEGPWILEWIAHYKGLGSDLIVVVHNDSDDGTNEILDYLSARGEIIAIRNVVAGPVSPQRKAFNSVLHLLQDVHACEWVAFLDADEFLVPLGRLDETFAGVIDDIEGRARQEGSAIVDAILLHWRWFSSPLQYNWEPGLTTERFTFSAENDHVKSIARISNVWSMSRLHVPALIRPGRAVNSAGHEVSISEQLKPPRYEVAQINHYFAKSFQEFVLKKARGRGAMGLAGPSREFENFLWGAHQLSFQRGDFSRTMGLLQSWLNDPILSKLNHASEENSRLKVRQFEQELDLPKLHAEITKYVKPVT
ncbi:glycosyltransferase family 2 protein [Bradyrhizobium sp. WSM471]|uniref:glycosyltransferase family 2 protein n=1 Tax=Bradyrhizobium sp. WSM471 TaxID=319017 RepID=UPI00024D21BB|nr:MULTISPECIES: glycosyltransferase family 2 protein [Bradyrhizobium]EHR01330.1 glycosyl transferase [Bradyrhizobium sp. WSM471]UFW43390.1 glycosyltransferase family 2 protein [Bradyrhizobium canariense]